MDEDIREPNTVGMQREQVRPLHAPMRQLYRVRQHIIKKRWAAVPESDRVKVKQLDKEGSD